VFPHYKFNLTNGSENLETMEYMKCGRVYHGRRDGDVGMAPTAILSRPIHILRLPARARGGGWGGGKERRKRCRVAVGQNTLPTRSRGGAAWFLSRSDRPSASSLHDVQRQPCFCRSEGKRLPLEDRSQATTGSILIDPTCKSGIMEAVKRLHSNLRMNRRKIRMSLFLSLFLSILCIS